MSLYEDEEEFIRPVWPRVVLICCIVALLIAAAGCGYLYFKTKLGHDNILDNITVAGIDVGGMSRDEAIAAVKAATADTYSVKAVIFTIVDTEYQIPPTLSGARLDVEAAVEAAQGYGRSGFLFRRYREQKDAASHIVTIDITPYLNLDTDAIRKEVNELAIDYNIIAKPHSYRFEGYLPDSADDETADCVLYVTVGYPGYALDGNRLYQQIIDAYNQNTLSFIADCMVSEPHPLDLQTLYEINCIPPVDATLDEDTYQVVPHTNGYGFKPQEVQDAIDNGEPGQELVFPFTVLEPEITTQKLEESLFQDLLSEYTAEYGSSYYRDINLKLSCQAIDGKILMPGQVFDYNSTLGERTQEAGYQLGNTYDGLEIIQTIGGGICQTSSTLYYCALMADLEIVTRSNHGFISDYVPYGMDATVSWGGPEFQFKNNTNYPIRIEAHSENGDVTIRLWGTDSKDYYVKMEYEVLEVYNWKKVEQEMTADNAQGYRDGQVITSPYTGYRIQTYRCKYSKANDELISKEPEALSIYNTRDQVVCKIIEKQPTEETPTTEATTPSGSTTPEASVPPESTEHTDTGSSADAPTTETPANSTQS